MTTASARLDQILKLDPAIRYAAIYQEGRVHTRQREEIKEPSESDSDRYEELLVNPTLLLLAKQRGDIDCGGMRFLVVRYGRFYQFVASVRGGHVSVCFELSANPLSFAEAILGLCDGVPAGSA